MKLSKAELDALDQAEGKAKRDSYLARIGRSIEDGWFTPQHHECAGISIRHQTCKSLCGKGLFEYRTIDYVQKRGRWCAINEYHITDAGLAHLKTVATDNK